MAGLSNYLRNKLIDWFHRSQAFAPPATVYIELCSTTPTASTAGTPLSGTGYARKPLASGLVNWAGTQADGTTAVSSGTSGTTSNNVDVDFGVAPAAWGTAASWEAYDALTSGNRLFFGTIVNGVGVATPRVINVGDPVKFPPAALRVEWG
jgi:hypothetical protein